VDALTHLHLPKIPTRDEFLTEARAIFARTRSLNEIVDHAYAHFLASVQAQLVTVR
jgi:stearoyl-CoA desaturase (Delta-9 desaturase)